VESLDQRRVILFAEDTPSDTSLLREFLKYSNLPYRLYIVHDGEAVLAFLHQQGFYAGIPRPHLIILDMGLLKRDDWKILTAIKATPFLTTIPLATLTNVMSAGNEEQRTALHPILCFVKPRNLKGYRSLVETLGKLIRQHTSRA
jgi:two-component system response regulator